MENFKIGDKVKFKKYVIDFPDFTYYNSWNLDVNKEYKITDVKGNIITINGRQIHDSFVEKVFQIGDKVLYLNKPEICEIVELYGSTCTLRMTPLLKYNGVLLTDIKLANMGYRFKVGDKVEIVSQWLTELHPKIYKILQVNYDLVKLEGLNDPFHISHLKLVQNVEKERVIKAANTSKEAYDLLKELYPDYFEDEKYFDLTKERLTDWVGKLNIGTFAYKSFYLSEKCNWEVSQDEQGRSILIPTKK